MVEIRKITTKAEISEFIDFRTRLYKDDPCAVPYLVMDEEETLSNTKNAAFEFCEAEYFMAYRDGKVVGRVAAIINNKANELWGKKNVRFGYFDFIDDLEVSKALLDAVRQYGKERGMDTIIGPMGFTDMDREGMLIEGFDTMASMHGNHNFPYYKEHMEKMGCWEKDNDWKQLLINIPDQVPEKFAKIADMIGRRYNIHPRHLTKKELIKGGYGHKFFHLLNDCYKDLYEFAPLSDKQIDKLLKDYLSIADLNLITFIFDDNSNELIGFGVSFPSFSGALRRSKNGKLMPFGWWHLLRTLFWHNTETVDLLLIGVKEEYRAKGANAILFDDLIKTYVSYGFKQALTLPMMETNDGVLSAWQYLDSHEAKRLRSYKSPI